MELFNLYVGIRAALYGIWGDLKTATLVGLFVGFGVWLALFLLQGFGLYAMAKRRNMPKKWLAFMPFANIYYTGKIVGECQFFGHKMKNVGLYTMIGQIVCTVLSAGFIFAETYLAANYVPTETQEGLLQWVGLTGFARGVNTFYEWSQLLVYIPTLITQILLLILMTGLLRKYSPSNQTFLSLLVFFVPLSRFIVVFVMRNREPFDYEAYMRRRQEEYMRRQQQYYNTYGNGNPYGTPPYGGQSPYGMGGYQGMNQPQPPQEEPFGEFTSEGNPQSGGESTGDGFFD